MVEAAVIISVLLMLILGMIDLGIAVMRYNSISQAAREAARQAMVHGALSPSSWNGGPWGPAKVSTTASAGSVPVVGAVRPYLFTVDDLDGTTIQVEWPDGSNEPGKRVRVTVSTPYHPMFTFILGNPSITLQATSTVIIAH
jgi:Flp pilus assembly protein TadG